MSMEASCLACGVVLNRATENEWSICGTPAMGARKPKVAGFALNLRRNGNSKRRSTHPAIGCATLFVVVRGVAQTESDWHVAMKTTRWLERARRWYKRPTGYWSTSFGPTEGLLNRRPTIFRNSVISHDEKVFCPSEGLQNIRGIRLAILRAFESRNNTLPLKQRPAL